MDHVFTIMVEKVLGRNPDVLGSLDVNGVPREDCDSKLFADAVAERFQSILVESALEVENWIKDEEGELVLALEDPTEFLPIVLDFQDGPHQYQVEFHTLDESLLWSTEKRDLMNAVNETLHNRLPCVGDLSEQEVHKLMLEHQRLMERFRYFEERWGADKVPPSMKFLMDQVIWEE